MRQTKKVLFHNLQKIERNILDVVTECEVSQWGYEKSGRLSLPGF